jgi:hypothetical protein
MGHIPRMADNRAAPRRPWSPRRTTVVAVVVFCVILVVVDNLLMTMRLPQEIIQKVNLWAAVFVVLMCVLIYHRANSIQERKAMIEDIKKHGSVLLRDDVEKKNVIGYRRSRLMRWLRGDDWVELVAVPRSRGADYINSIHATLSPDGGVIVFGPNDDSEEAA